MIILIWNSIKEAFKLTWKWFFGSFSSSVAVFLFLSQRYNWEIIDSIAIAIITFITVICIRSVFIYFSKWRNKKYIYPGKNVYGEAIKILADGFARVHQYRKKTQPNVDNNIEALVALCSCIKKLFDLKTESKCSVSIKVITSNVLIDQINPEANVITLCRDADNITSRNNGKKGLHNIFNNSCFSHILDNIGKPKGKYYINNNLPADLTYKNTSFEVYGSLPEDAKTEKERTVKWKLPYMSEIVVPITPMVENSVSHNELIGFLCVDSSKKDSFNINYDVPLIRGVADGIYDLLEAIYKNEYKNN